MYRVVSVITSIKIHKNIWILRRARFYNHSCIAIPVGTSRSPDYSYIRLAAFIYTCRASYSCTAGAQRRRRQLAGPYPTSKQARPCCGARRGLTKLDSPKRLLYYVADNCTYVVQLYEATPTAVHATGTAVVTRVLLSVSL